VVIMLARTIPIINVTVGILDTGIWLRVKRWKDAGYWLVWERKEVFSERFGVDLPIWEVC